MLGTVGLPSAVSTHRVRQYTHVFGSVCPQDGELISLILPHADTAAMSLYFAEVSRRHPDQHILILLRGPGWHRAKALVVPDNLTFDWLPLTARNATPRNWSGRKSAGNPLAITIMIRWTRSKTPWHSVCANWNPPAPSSNPSPVLIGLLMLHRTQNSIREVGDSAWAKSKPCASRGIPGRCSKTPRRCGR